MSQPQVKGWSPWGTIQNVEKLGLEMWFVSTASHGGIKVSDRLNKMIPNEFRMPGGWYEEDCNWAIPWFFLWNELSVKKQNEKNTEGVPMKDVALDTILCWHWKEWEVHTGEVVPLEKSSQKASYLFQEANRSNLVTVAAWGSSISNNVPEGMVGVKARRASNGDEGYFLVMKAEYDTRHNNASGSFVIDPSRHQTWSGPK